MIHVFTRRVLRAVHTEHGMSRERCFHSVVVTIAEQFARGAAGHAGQLTHARRVERDAAARAHRAAAVGEDRGRTAFWIEPKHLDIAATMAEDDDIEDEDESEEEEED